MREGLAHPLRGFGPTGSSCGCPISLRSSNPSFGLALIPWSGCAGWFVGRCPSGGERGIGSPASRARPYGLILRMPHLAALVEPVLRTGPHPLVRLRRMVCWALPKWRRERDWLTRFAGSALRAHPTDAPSRCARRTRPSDWPSSLGPAAPDGLLGVAQVAEREGLAHPLRGLGPTGSSCGCPISLRSSNPSFGLDLIPWSGCAGWFVGRCPSGGERGIGSPASRVRPYGLILRMPHLATLVEPVLRTGPHPLVRLRRMVCWALPKWRRERDSNPRSLSAQWFSRPPHSATLPSLLRFRRTRDACG